MQKSKLPWSDNQKGLGKPELQKKYRGWVCWVLQRKIGALLP